MNELLFEDKISRGEQEGGDTEAYRHQEGLPGLASVGRLPLWKVSVPQSIGEPARPLPSPPRPSPRPGDGTTGLGAAA